MAKYAATCGQEAAVFAKAFLEMNFETTRTKLECSGYTQTSTSSSYSVTTTTGKSDKRLKGDNSSFNQLDLPYHEKKKKKN